MSYSRPGFYLYILDAGLPDIHATDVDQPVFFTPHNAACGTGECRIFSVEFFRCTVPADKVLSFRGDVFTATVTVFTEPATTVS